MLRIPIPILRVRNIFSNKTHLYRVCLGINRASPSHMPLSCAMATPAAGYLYCGTGALLGVHPVKTNPDHTNGQGFYFPKTTISA
jgi:hypothetical protein